MRRHLQLLAALCLFAGPHALAAAPTPLSPGAATLAAYLRIDTTHPAGNERAGVELLAAALRAGGIEPQILVSPLGRANLYARLPATATAPGLAAETIVLLHHIDTVAAGAGWKHPALAGEVHDGELWGRGAIDAKGLGVAQLMAFLDLARSREPRRRTSNRTPSRITKMRAKMFRTTKTRATTARMKRRGPPPRPRAARALPGARMATTSSLSSRPRSPQRSAPPMPTSSGAP